MNTQLPLTMRAAVYRGPGDVRIETVPVPAIGPGEVLVRVAACGVCHTDLKKVAHGLLPPPRIFGHETSGVIAATGRGVRGWRAGDRVAVFHHIPCGRCFYCRRDAYPHCATYRRTGATAGFEPAGGGFAEYVRVLPWIVRRGMVRVPARVTLDEAALLEPLVTCLRGVERLRLRRGDVVLIFGQGPIGLLFTQLVRTRGARAVALDLLPRRLSLARRLGAELACDPRGGEFARKLAALTAGRGADAAILAVPAAPAFTQALAAVRPAGQVLLFAHTRKGESLTFDAGMVCVEEKVILGSYSSSVDVQAEAARLLFSRRVRVTPLITHRFPLERIQEAFHLAEHPGERSLKVLVTPGIRK